jgi:hypothetical protein
MLRLDRSQLKRNIGRSVCALVSLICVFQVCPKQSTYVIIFVLFTPVSVREDRLVYVCLAALYTWRPALLPLRCMYRVYLRSLYRSCSVATFSKPDKQQNCLSSEVSYALAHPRQLQITHKRLTASQATAGDMKLHYPKPHVIQSKEKCTAAVIMLHGLGDTAAGWSPVGEQLRHVLPHVKWIFPNAPEVRADSLRCPLEVTRTRLSSMATSGFQLIEQSVSQWSLKTLFIGTLSLYNGALFRLILANVVMSARYRLSQLQFSYLEGTSWIQTRTCIP